MRYSSGSGTPRFGGRYEHKVAVISGASSGLGHQLAIDLSVAGALVVAVARRGEILEKLETEMRKSSPHSVSHECDVSDTEAWISLLTSVESEYGRIDILVNNAGFDPGIRLAEIALEDFERTFAVNFLAVVASTLGVLPGMIERREGIVANVSSDGGRLPSPGPGAYSGSKAAVSAFTESVSFRASRHGVSMHVIYPAWMPTPMGFGALERGLRRPPPLTRRTEEQVSRLVLSHLGRRGLIISASRVIDAAEVFRVLSPRLYRRFRRYW